MFRKLVILILAVLSAAACSRRQALTVRTPMPSDSLYTARAAMKMYGRDPERALTIVDSAVIVGNVNAFQADFLRASIYANSLEAPQWDKAIVMCERLLQHDSTQIVDKATANNRGNVLVAIMGASRKARDDKRWIQYAIELADLRRSQGNDTEALRMEAEIGAVLTRLGRKEEGMIKLEQAIRALDQGAPSVDRMDAGIVARKRRIFALDQLGRYADIPADAQAIIQKLDDYQKRPSEYAEDSFRLPDNGTEARARYCNFYRAQAHYYMALAYTHITPSDIVLVQKHLREAENSEYGRSLMGRWAIAPVWKALGQWDKLMAIDTDLERHLGADTLSEDYARILRDRAAISQARGQHSLAVSYLDRYTRLKEQLNEKRIETQAQEYASRYHALDQDRIIREEKLKSDKKDAAILVISVILLLLAAFTFFTVSQRRSIVEKNRALVRMIDQLNEAKDALKADVSQPDRTLFERIDGTIRKEKLYTNAKLQRQNIVERFNINRHALNDLLSAYAGGMSFTAYINNLRLQDAIHLLHEKPELSISDIAEAVGFTPATFREQFKCQYGMTPTEYRQNI